MTTLHEINEKARAVLRTALGPVDYARFFQQYSNGSGDYTKERQQRPVEGVQVIHERTMALQEAGLLPVPPNAKILKL